jgi:hypothetical protein
MVPQARKQTRATRLTRGLHRRITLLRTREGFNSARIHGTSVPVEKPATASIAPSHDGHVRLRD